MDAFTILRLPDGQLIQAEVMRTRSELERGLMGRPSLASDCGMLFVHPKPGFYSYWMRGVSIPLDILWLDSQRRIVAFVRNAQPGQGSFQPNHPAQFVLELAGGTARNLKLGQSVEW